MDIFDFIIFLILGLPAFLLGFMIGRVASSDADTYIPSSKELQKYDDQLRCLLATNEKAKKLLCLIMNSKEDLSSKTLGEIAMIFSTLEIR